jgi:hypothetical protein
MPENSSNSEKRRTPECKELEEHEPGASREEVLAALERTAQPAKEESPRRSKKRGK